MIIGLLARFTLLWAHPVLVTQIDPAPNVTGMMRIELDAAEGDDAYSNFVGLIRNSETRRGYTRNLKRFLSLILDDIFEQHAGGAPASRETEDLAEAFVRFAKRGIAAAKSIIKSYVRETNKEVERGQLSPNTVPNMIKPIKVLLVSNEVDVS